MLWGFWVLWSLVGLGSIFLYRYLKDLKLKNLWIARLSFIGGSLFSCLWLLALSFYSSLEAQGLLFNNISFVFLVSVICSVLSLRKNLLNVALFAASALFLLVGILGIWGNLFPRYSFPSAWVWAHIAFLVVGEVLLFLTAAIALARLWSEYKLSKKEIPFLGGSSLPELDRRLLMGMRWGFLFLSLGILMGIFSAKQVWQGEWWTDVKIVLAVSSWLVYFVLVLLSALKILGARGVAIGSLLGFLLVALVVGSLGRWTDIEEWRKPNSQVEEMPE